MNTKGWLEKRDNIRAEISTKVRIKLIDDDVAHALMLHKESASQSTGKTVPKKDLAMERSRNGNSVTMSDFPSSLDDTTHPALTYLVDSVFLLNDKLDKIIDLLESNKGKNKITVKKTVNISGTGMKLIVYNPVNKGQILDISLNMPGFPLGGFTAYGEVVRTREFEQKSKSLYEIGVKFINIREKEREMLIAYAFSQERQKIRQLKKDIT